MKKLIMTFALIVAPVALADDGLTALEVAEAVKIAIEDLADRDASLADTLYSVTARKQGGDVAVRLYSRSGTQTVRTDYECHKHGEIECHRHDH